MRARTEGGIQRTVWPGIGGTLPSRLTLSVPVSGLERFRRSSLIRRGHQRQLPRGFAAVASELALETNGEADRGRPQLSLHRITLLALGRLRSSQSRRRRYAGRITRAAGQDRPFFAVTTPWACPEFLPFRAFYGRYPWFSPSISILPR